MGKKAAAVVAYEAVGLLGLGALLFGVWQINRPATFMVAGSLAIVWAVLKMGGRP